MNDPNPFLVAAMLLCAAFSVWAAVKAISLKILASRLEEMYLEKCREIGAMSAILTCDQLTKFRKLSEEELSRKTTTKKTE